MTELGLGKTNASSLWTLYDQRSVLPAALSGLLTGIEFPDSGTCDHWIPVHGWIDHGRKRPQDVWRVSCAGSWTGGNVVAPVNNISRWAYELYHGPAGGTATHGRSIVDNTSRAIMLNFSAPDKGDFVRSGYGMGAMNLTWSVGVDVSDVHASHALVNAVGHGGSTYGYTSQVPRAASSLPVVTAARKSSHVVTPARESPHVVGGQVVTHALLPVGTRRYMPLHAVTGDLLPGARLLDGGGDQPGGGRCIAVTW